MAKKQSQNQPTLNTPQSTQPIDKRIPPKIPFFQKFQPMNHSFKNTPFGSRVRGNRGGK